MWSDSWKTLEVRTNRRVLGGRQQADAGLCTQLTFLYAESGIIGYYGGLWPRKSWFNSKPRNQSVYGVTVGDLIIVKMSLWS